jgi:Meiotically up-regulated gene 113
MPAKLNIIEVDGVKTAAHAGVYLIGASKREWYKIGSSGNLYNRLRGLLPAIPFHLDTVHVWPTEDKHASALESCLHRAFKDARMTPNSEYSEWYRLPVKRLADVRARAEEYIRAHPMRVEAQPANLNNYHLILPEADIREYEIKCCNAVRHLL